jgi:hypothetical protein
MILALIYLWTAYIIFSVRTQPRPGSETDSLSPPLPHLRHGNAAIAPWTFSASLSLFPAIASFFVSGFLGEVLQLVALVPPATLLMVALARPLYEVPHPSIPAHHPASILQPATTLPQHPSPPAMVPAEVHEDLAGRLAAAAIEIQQLRDSLAQINRTLQSSQAESKQLAQSNRALRDQLQAHGFSPTPIEELSPEQLDIYRRRLADELKRTDALIKKRGATSPHVHRSIDLEKNLFT